MIDPEGVATPHEEAFLRGYVGAIRADLSAGQSGAPLSAAAAQQIATDCADIYTLIENLIGPAHFRPTREDGVAFWRQRKTGDLKLFPPLFATVDGGEVYLRKGNT